MSESKVNAKKLSPVLSQSIRENRLEVSNSINFKVIVANQECFLKNISDTGVSLLSKNEFNVNDEGVLTILFSSTQKIELKGKFVWKRKEGEMNLLGFHFVDQYLPEGLLVALDKMASIKSDVSERISGFNNLDGMFKQVTFEIKFFLEETKTRLDNLETEINIQSENYRNSFFEVFKNNFEEEFIKRLIVYSIDLDKAFSKITDKYSRKNHAEFFRSQVGQYYTQSPFGARALIKPRGYAGDYEMMNQIYRNHFEGRTFFDMLMHRYGILETSSQSVRYRRSYFVEKIKKNSLNKKNVNFASLACGPAREVIDFLQTVDVAESHRYNFILLDQDTEALLNAKRNIYEQILKRNLECKVRYLPLSVKHILEQHEDAASIADIGYDMIYTAGLYDYLTQPVAKMLTHYLLKWLKKDGELIIGNFSPLNPTKAIKELAADWKLIHRTENEMMDLVENEKYATAEVIKDDQGIDLFLEVKL